MEISSPATGVLQITRLSFFSCHLFHYGDGLTLIDTGLPGSVSGIEKAIKQTGLKLRHILITHGHTDHCGSFDRVSSLHPGIDAVASARTARLMTGDRSLLPEDKGRPLRGSFSVCKTAPGRIVGDGESAGGLRAIFTPGHAPGHVSYFHEGTGFLFPGDAFHTAGGRLAVSGEFRVFFPFPYFATWDRELALSSAKRLRDLKPAAIFPAHGPAIHDPAQAMDEAIDHAESAFAGARAARGASPAA